MVIPRKLLLSQTSYLVPRYNIATSNDISLFDLDLRSRSQLKVKGHRRGGVCVLWMFLVELVFIHYWYKTYWFFIGEYNFAISTFTSIICNHTITIQNKITIKCGKNMPTLSKLILDLSAKFELDRCTNNGDLLILWDREKKHIHTHASTHMQTHRLKLILFQYTIHKGSSINKNGNEWIFCWMDLR